MMVQSKCQKCEGDMIKSYIKGNFAIIKKDGMLDGIETDRYMCIECGYIEEYAIDPKFYAKTD